MMKAMPLSLSHKKVKWGMKKRPAHTFHVSSPSPPPSPSWIFLTIEGGCIRSSPFSIRYFTILSVMHTFDLTMSKVRILLADTGSQLDILDLYYLLLICGMLNEAQIENAKRKTVPHVVKCVNCEYGTNRKQWHTYDSPLGGKRKLNNGIPICRDTKIRLSMDTGSSGNLSNVSRMRELNDYIFFRINLYGSFIHNVTVSVSGTFDNFYLTW